MSTLKYIQSSTCMTVTLGSSYASGSGTMTLTAGNGALLPSSGDFWITYNPGGGTIRIFKVTARSTDTLTVVAVSGEGSGDGNISSGETLRWALSYDAIDQLRADMCGYGTYANLPATCKVGDRYVTSDSIYDFVATATNTWTAFYMGRKVVIVDNSGFSDLNSPSGVSTTGGPLYIKSTSTGSDNLRGRVKNLPTAPYTMDFEILPHFFEVGTGAQQAAFTLYDNTKLCTFGIGTTNSPTAPRIEILPWTNVTTGAAAKLVTTPIPTGVPVIRFRFQDNNTNWIYSWSVDRGLNWEQLYSETRNTFLTATKYGFIINHNVGSGQAACSVVHLEVS